MADTQPKIWNWGIVGTGRIASDFFGALKTIPNARVVAVGGSSLERAKNFATQWNIPRAYGSYAELAADPEVEIVYVCTLHPHHKAAAIVASEHGKPVLCEKPLAMNHSEASEMINAAKKNNTFFMEAMWTRYFPLTQKIKSLVKEGVIGKVTSVDVKLGFSADPNLPRLADKQHGASALLDVGIYCVTMVSMILGPHPPKTIEAVAEMSPDGQFDNQTAVVLGYGDAIGICHSSFSAALDNHATIVGTKGRITWEPHWCPTSFTVLKSDGTKQVFDHTTNPEYELPQVPGGHSFNFRNSSGLAHEARYVQDALERGLKESEHESFEESLTIMKILDSVASKIGFANKV